MSDRPRFSVVIGNYNYAQFVGTAIASALDQTYPPEQVEVVVVDDGSTDDSRAVITAFAGDPRLRAVFQENRGQSAAFAAGVRVARGDYVCLLDADDSFCPDKLARVAARIGELGAAATELFLCHDLSIANAGPGGPVRQTWFEVVGIDDQVASLTPGQATHSFPFAVPSGLIFSRGLIAACLDAVPSWDFRRGTDGVLCPQALLKVGRVHYQHECLSTYRVHGGNELASVVDGRFVARIDWRARLPKTLRFLEQWLDSLDLSADQRAEGFTYLRRAEHVGRRLSASRSMDAPRVSVIVFGGDTAAGQRSAESAEFQSAGCIDVCAEPAAAAATGPGELARIARAYTACDGEYLVFLRAGDRLDREYVERHLHWRQRGALVGLTCSDVRLEGPDGSLVHTDIFRGSGLWKQAQQQIPPLVTTLGDWVAPPLAACMYRRNAFFDRLLGGAADLPPRLQAAGLWLLFQLQLHTSGALRFCDTLVTCRLEDGAAASYGFLSMPQSLQGTLWEPPVAEALAWLRQFYGREQALFRRWLPPRWHQRFALWLAQQELPPPA